MNQDTTYGKLNGNETISFISFWNGPITEILEEATISELML